MAPHIQTHGEAGTHLKHYWAYADRVLPCKSDKGTCEYLDAVYWMHDVSMLYTFILWAVLGGAIALFVLIRYIRSVVRTAESSSGPKFAARAYGAVSAWGRRWFLPEVVQGVTRLQVTVLAVLAGYLLVFS